MSFDKLLIVSAEEDVRWLRTRGVDVNPGLTDDELAQVEHRFGFRFSVDHRAFLSVGQPVGGRWWDWRGPASPLEEALAWPRAGVLWDVENDDYWAPSWGVRPSSLRARLEAANGFLDDWPVLVPLYGHRYVPAAPASASAPVFSVWQTDVIAYGENLGDYLRREFGDRDEQAGTPSVDSRACPPWSLFATGQEELI